MKKNV